MSSVKPLHDTRPHIRTPSRAILILLTTFILLLSLISQTTLPQPDCRRFLNHEDPFVLVLTAHPDDECMFFGPTVLALTGQGIMTSGLSLSRGEPLFGFFKSRRFASCASRDTNLSFRLCVVGLIGNADGLGDIRQTELVRSYTVLGVPPHRVLSLDDP
jgi:hypothetical protein